MKFARAAVFLAFAVVTAGAAFAQDITEGIGAKGRPGQKVLITPGSLPKPGATQPARNMPANAPKPADAALALPAGFAASVFVEGDFKRVRWAITGPNGDVFVADSQANTVFVLRDSNKDGKIDNATERFVFATELNQPFGMALQGGYFYVGNTDSVVRYKYAAGQTKAEGAAEKIIDLPGKGYNQHWTRNLLFNRDGKKLYVSVGSESNVNEEAEPRRAAISEYNPDGSGHRIFASGIRNPIGLAWNPTSGALWTAVNERDGLGDDLVPDYVTSVKDGGFYGWPYSYIGQNPQPTLVDKRPDLVAKAIVPDVLIEAHAAALGLVFYTGNMFPRDYEGDAFVALHGSWNRSKRSGYKVIRIPFKSGKPEGGYENFMTGWVLDESGREVWGRPVGLAQLRDGSLLVVDDGGNKIWRITYSGRR